MLYLVHLVNEPLSMPRITKSSVGHSPGKVWEENPVAFDLIPEINLEKQIETGTSTVI